MRNNLAKLGIPNLPQSLYIRQNSDGDITNFRISGQSLKNKNCYNSKTSYDIDTKLEPITEIDNRRTTTLKNSTMT